jgi:plasmid stabilization system protein ParE
MSFVVKKLPLAEQDALDAAIWYEERQPGLGDEFLTEVDRAVRTLCETPLLHRVRFADVRRASVHRFRFYGVYYIVNEQEVWVLAIFHGRRHPRRLEKSGANTSDKVRFRKIPRRGRRGNRSPQSESR